MQNKCVIYCKNDNKKKLFLTNDMIKLIISYKIVDFKNMNQDFMDILNRL